MKYVEIKYKDIEKYNLKDIYGYYLYSMNKESIIKYIENKEESDLSVYELGKLTYDDLRNCQYKLLLVPLSRICKLGKLFYNETNDWKECRSNGS